MPSRRFQHYSRNPTPRSRHAGGARRIALVAPLSSTSVDSAAQTPRLPTEPSSFILPELDPTWVPATSPRWSPASLSVIVRTHRPKKKLAAIVLLGVAAACSQGGSGKTEQGNTEATEKVLLTDRCRATWHRAPPGARPPVPVNRRTGDVAMRSLVATSATEYTHTHIHTASRRAARSWLAGSRSGQATHVSVSEGKGAEDEDRGLGKGNVGGGLADLWKKAGHDIVARVGK